jgi:uncharacterized tellurite resistance protein B-like protein
MIDLIKQFFSKNPLNSRPVPGGEPSRDIRVATCAILLEMARVDGKFSDSEKSQIIQTLEDVHGLSEEAVIELIKATSEKLEESIDLWHFTNLINQNYSVEEKIQVIEMVWRLAYSDGVLEEHEDYLLHKLANLLHLTHKQLIEAKLKVLHGDTSKKDARLN